MKENLSLFLEAAKSNIEEAKKIFFGDNFKKFYLQEERKLQDVYDQLMMGRNRNQILEEFLICAGAKERVSFEAEEFYEVSPKEEFLIIPIRQKNWGYEELQIQTHPAWKAEVSLITTKQFCEGRYELKIDISKAPQSPQAGFVTLDTAFWHHRIEIHLKDEKEESRQKMRRMTEEIYLDFRRGKITTEEYCTQSFQCVAEEFGILGDLFRLQLAIVGNREEEAQNRMEQMKESRPWEDGRFIESYYYYLKALYEKNALTTKSAVEIIRDNYNKAEDHRGGYLWMLLYLDEEFAFSNKKQMEELKRVYQEGSFFAMLFYEVSSNWNRNPLSLKEIDDFTIANMRFGLRYEILSKEVLDQYARIIRRMDGFSREGFKVLEEIYQKYPEEEYLKSICKTVIRTGQSETAYHKYLQDAVKGSLKMIGLFEAYIRTMDFEQDEVLESSVLHYFSYSNSLSVEEKAYLYANIYANRKTYGEILKSYSQKIDVFALKAMERGLMTKPSVYLYQKYLPDLMGSEAGLIALPNIIFKRKLICQNPKMKMAVVKHMEKKHPDVYELVDGMAYCDIYSDQVTVFFLDEKEDPYMTGIEWQFEKLWNEALYYERCHTKNVFHEKVLLVEAGRYVKKAKLEVKEVMTAQRLMDLQILSDDAKEFILELLLNYYYENREYKKLEEYLLQVRWEKIQEKNQAPVIEYFISQKMYPEALKGMERYGFDVIRVDLLEPVLCYLLGELKGRKSMFAAKMCEAVFLHGKASPQVIAYLQTHVPPEAAYLEDLWKKGMEQEIYQSGFTQYVLAKFLEEERDAKIYLEIFLTYCEKEEIKGRLVDMLFERFCTSYYMQKKELPDVFFDNLFIFLKEGQWKSNVQPLAWLKFKIAKANFTEEEKKLAAYLTEWFLDKELYLPLFLQLGDVLQVPKNLATLTFVTFFGPENEQVVLHCEEEKYAFSKKETMKEVFNGMYAASFLAFAGEHPDVYVTIEGEEKKYRKSVTVTDPPRDDLGLKYHKINQMIRKSHSSQVYDMMETYSEREYMMKHLLKPWMED